MFSKDYKVFCVCLSLFNVIISVQTVKRPSDAIGFPEVEEDVRLKNKENRLPVYIPSMCPENELYYPGDQKDDWICDCRPSHLYDPGSDRCWPAWQQGPCTAGHYLILPQNSVKPVCVKNPCNTNLYVTWLGRCEQLGSLTPCRHLYPVAAALGINATDLRIDCVKLSLENRFGEADDSAQTVLMCPPGCKRSISGMCVPISSKI